MDNTIRGEFYFHPVGQGLFYSGTLRSGTDCLRFVYDCGAAQKTKFRDRAVKNYRDHLMKGDILDLLQSGTQLLKSLSEILGDEEKIEKLKGALQKFHKNINRSSVTMLHRPAGLSTVKDFREHCNRVVMEGFLHGSSFYPDCLHLDWEKASEPKDETPFNQMSTFLTGDLELKLRKIPELKPRESLDLMKEIKGSCPGLWGYGFPRKIEDCKCLILQYPHHGSDNNDMKQFVDLEAVLNVVPFGLKNGYKHPGETVLLNLPRFFPVHERLGLCYTLWIYYK